MDQQHTWQEGAQPATEQAPPPRTPPAKRSFIKKVGKGAGWILGLDVYAKQTRILSKRASFPLLREVMKNHARTARTIIPVETIHNDLLISTHRYQRMLCWVLGAAIPLILMMLARGLGLALRFGEWSNSFLLFSVPLGLAISTQWLISLKVCRTVAAEIASRRQAEVAHG